MNTTQVAKIIDDMKETITKQWRSAKILNGHDDFMAIITIENGVTSVVVLSRTTGLTMLEPNPSFDRLREPAIGPTPGSPAIWLVLHENDSYRIAKLADVPVNDGTNDVN